MEKYTGEKDIRQFLSFLRGKQLNPVPLSPEKIAVICRAFPHHRLPQPYLDFLAAAGGGYAPWVGSTYVLVDKDHQFVDLGEWIREFEEDDEKFREYGFSYEDTLIFWTHQGNAYAFFNLNDTSDDPPVYFMICDAVGPPRKGIPFSEFVINDYNDYVELVQIRRNPWSAFDLPKDFPEIILNELKQEFAYSPEAHSIQIPYAHDVYAIHDTMNMKAGFEAIHAILNACIKDFESVLVYANGVLYNYHPNEDKQLDNSVRLNIYQDKTILIERQKHRFGWFVVKDKVYVFGDQFRKLIKEHIGKFDLTKE